LSIQLFITIILHETIWHISALFLMVHLPSKNQIKLKHVQENS